MRLEIDLPKKASDTLIPPARFKILYGGRDSAKSWSIARMLLARGLSKPERILCTREVQKSIAESVHQLLSDQVKVLGLAQFYDIQKTCIIGKNGTQISYHGLSGQTIASLKSFEGTTLCWVEEAQTVSKRSWDILIPTIRAPGSEIWASFNPDLDTDPTYTRFVLSEQPDCVVRSVSYRDNPYFPDILEQERLALQRNDPIAYANVWEGKCKSAVEGAFWAAELQAAETDGRICEVPYDNDYPVTTYWDIGGTTCVWFVQHIGSGRINVIDFLKTFNIKYSETAQQVIEKGYVFGEHVLPWDAGPILGPSPHSGKTAEQMLIDAGLRRTRVLGKTTDKIADINNACRGIFARTWIDRDKCADGLFDLRRFKRRQSAITKQFVDEPLKDGSDHAADAWRALAVSATTAQYGTVAVRRPVQAVRFG